eukprot:TRINITY_DN5583_c1_g1_i1.p1 TRINITY_DN5583_c1_g1~~TRINITY_DN5583_c1_g1_i1.p1  ORF type:complete len:283 (-),score=38.98 TRINITY_DN5583_c1_g1_i1:159-1007(-)
MGAALICLDLLYHRVRLLAAAVSARRAAAGDRPTAPIDPHRRGHGHPLPLSLPPLPRPPLDALAAWTIHAVVLWLTVPTAAAVAANSTPLTPPTPPSMRAEASTYWHCGASGRAATQPARGHPSPQMADGAVIGSTEIAARGGSATSAAPSSVGTSNRATTSTVCGRRGTETRPRGHGGSAAGDEVEGRRRAYKVRRTGMAGGAAASAGDEQPVECASSAPTAAGGPPQAAGAASAAAGAPPADVGAAVRGTAVVGRGAPLSTDGGGASAKPAPRSSGAGQP